MATHSSIFAWKIQWMEEPGRLQSMGSQSWDITEQLHFTISLKENRASTFPMGKNKNLLEELYGY